VEVVNHIEVVHVARYVKALSEDHRRALSRAISKVKDARTTRGLIGGIESSGDKGLQIVVDDSRNPITSASVALKLEGFKDVSADLLGALVMELMQDIATNKTLE